MNKIGTPWGRIVGRCALPLLSCLLVGLTWGLTPQSSASRKPARPAIGQSAVSKLPRRLLHGSGFRGNASPGCGRRRAAQRHGGPSACVAAASQGHSLPPRGHSRGARGCGGFRSGMPGPHFNYHGGWNPLPYVIPYVAPNVNGQRYVPNPVTGQMELRGPGRWDQHSDGSWSYDPLPFWPPGSARPSRRAGGCKLAMYCRTGRLR